MICLSITFQVYVRGSQWVPPSHIDLQNFTACSYTSTGAWSESCFDHWRGIGSHPVATVWQGTSGSVTNNRYGRTVRGMVSVQQSTYTIYKARVKVVYTVLQ